MTATVEEKKETSKDTKQLTETDFVKGLVENRIATVEKRKSSSKLTCFKSCDSGQNAAPVASKGITCFSSNG